MLHGMTTEVGVNLCEEYVSIKVKLCKECVSIEVKLHHTWFDRVFTSCHVNTEPVRG
jgi:hypothetical protein